MLNPVASPPYQIPTPTPYIYRGMGLEVPGHASARVTRKNQIADSMALTAV